MSTDSDTNSYYNIVNPEYLLLENGESVCNPFYDEKSITEYWGYKLLISSFAEEGATHLYIPISSCIESDNLEVRENILSLDRTQSVGFNLIPLSQDGLISDINLLDIPINNRFSNAESVVYTISVKGHYGASKGNVYLKTANKIFSIEEVMTPITSPSQSLTVMNHCEIKVLNNKGYVDFKSTLLNSGSMDLMDITYTHKMNYLGSEIAIGEIVEKSEEVFVSSESFGQLSIASSVDRLDGGESKILHYAFPIVSVDSPGNYEFFNCTVLKSPKLSASYTSRDTLDVIKILPELNFHIISDDIVRLDVSLTNPYPSPPCKCTLKLGITIPSNMSVVIKDFYGYDAKLSSSNERAIRNKEIRNDTVLLEIPAMLVLNSTFSLSFEMRILRIDNFLGEEIYIESVLDYDFYLDDTHKLLINDSSLPLVRTLKIIGDVSDSMK